MRNERTRRFVAILTENKVQLLVTLVSVVIAIVNFLIVNKLQPVAQDLQSLVGRVNAMENKVVYKDEFNQVVTRLNYLTSRVDQIFSIVASQK